MYIPQLKLINLESWGFLNWTVHIPLAPLPLEINLGGLRFIVFWLDYLKPIGITTKLCNPTLFTMLRAPNQKIKQQPLFKKKLPFV
ncbi:ABC superfamily ATP binding cassette transporter sugar permease [Sporosarcina newyorkensis 2681]|uniref:ABC superfamily ATP binding cassette transporter sugar permease n=1 Tax=Sporosarcina newyorkensis 2681 TaxID=1027292 RepID=F9DNV3_9BACL|nr:ABC superfamily ATP binding cassette transporter sugar permease [Sporosarcina newyorkensis 2681]